MIEDAARRPGGERSKSMTAATFAYDEEQNRRVQMEVWHVGRERSMQDVIEAGDKRGGGSVSENVTTRGVIEETYDSSG